MRHLISPLDFSVEELDRLLDLAGDILQNTRTPVMERFWRPCFMSRVQERD